MPGDPVQTQTRPSTRPRTYRGVTPPEPDSRSGRLTLHSLPTPEDQRRTRPRGPSRVRSQSSTSTELGFPARRQHSDRVIECFAEAPVTFTRVRPNQPFGSRPESPGHDGSLSSGQSVCAAPRHWRTAIRPCDLLARRGAARAHSTGSACFGDVGPGTKMLLPARPNEHK